MQRFCLALDLKDDPKLISEYEKQHKNIWPEIKKSIKDAGVEQMEIFRAGNRMFMIIEVDDTFSFEKKEAMDRANEKVQEWEKLMWKYQQALPFAKPGEKWVLMDRMFQLEEK